MQASGNVKTLTRNEIALSLSLLCSIHFRIALSTFKSPIHLPPPP